MDSAGANEQKSIMKLIILNTCFMHVYVEYTCILNKAPVEQLNSLWDLQWGGYAQNEIDLNEIYV